MNPYAYIRRNVQHETENKTDRFKLTMPGTNVSAAESTPLLDSSEAPDSFLQSLDEQYDRNDENRVSPPQTEYPSCPKRRAVQRYLTDATFPSGHGHPMHRPLQSPCLILRLQQIFEHGFAKMYGAVRQAVASASKREQPITPSVFFHVGVVFVVAMLVMLSQTSVSPSLLLYMNHVGFTSQSNISSYVVTSSLQSAVPIASNIIIGKIATTIGQGNALAIGAVFSAFGVALMALSRTSLVLFFIGYTMYSSANSLRIVRVSILSKIVASKDRTTVFATHSLMTPVGALIGPLLWILCSMYRGESSFGPLPVDRFSLAYFTAGFALLLIALISITLLRNISSSNNSGSRDHDDISEDLREITIQRADGRETVVDLQTYRNRIFMYFCGIMLGVNMSAGVFMTAFQPILVNEFHTADAKLGVIFEMIAGFAIVPPMLVAILSKYLMDREIMVIGLCSKLIGMALFLPLFGQVREWQVIVGFMLIIKASIFFSTAGMSLFTKLLGSMSTSTLLGLLASGSSVGPALAQLLLSGHIVQLFGSFWFGLFAVPALVSLGLMLMPRFWYRLNAEREFTQLITQHVDERLDASRASRDSEAQQPQAS